MGALLLCTRPGAQKQVSALPPRLSSSPCPRQRASEATIRAPSIAAPYRGRSNTASRENNGQRARRADALIPRHRAADLRGMASGGGAATPLQVPLADVTAKNLRASLHMRRPSAFDSRGELKQGVSLLDSLAPSPARSADAIEPKFGRLVDDSPSLVARARAFLARLRAARAQKSAAQAPPTHKSDAVPRAAGAMRGLAKLCDVLGSMLKTAPMLPFFCSLLATLVLHEWKPALFLRIPMLTHALSGTMLLAALFCALWKRGEPLRILAAGARPYAHPIDSCLDAYADSLTERDAAVKAGLEELRTHRAQLDALRKELAKDPAASDPSAVLKPSRKAAAMIAAGALGAGFDAEKAAEAERLRKQDTLRRSREQWRERGEQSAGELDEFSQMLQDHAATGYRKHTKELKMRSTPQGPRQAVPLAAFRRAAVVGSIASAMVRREGSGSSAGGRNQGGRREGSGSGSGAPVFGSFNSYSGKHGSGDGHGLRRAWNGGGRGGANGTPRRYSGASDASVRTAASAPVTRHNSRRKKMHLFRRKRARGRPDEDATRSVTAPVTPARRDYSVTPGGRSADESPSLA